MADIRKRVPENVEGEFFVDATCIDCDTCRQLAPATFAEADDHSYVHAQPSSDDERRLATRALLSCPTASIGTTGESLAREVMGDFPLLVAEGVYYNGYTSPKSYGGASWFIRRPEGNWLVDSPKYLPQLFQAFEAMGGIRTIFLTHRDDVAEAARYAAKFEAERIIHADDLDAQPDAERVITGVEPLALGEDFLAIPTPGHTRGHMVLLYRERFLFTGDHLSWDRHRERLHASRSTCWYSWSQQTESMARLLERRFEWVLPGHGQWKHLPAERMHEEMAALVARMRG